MYMTLLKLSLFENFFYSNANSENSSESIITNDGSVFYRVKNQTDICICKGQYIFCQERIPFQKDFIQKNKILLEAFAKNKNVKLDYSKIYFRTLTEDNKIAYQFWIGIL